MSRKAKAYDRMAAVSHAKGDHALGNHWAEQADYYRLCDEARALGIPTSLDDPNSPKTVAGLRDAIKFARWHDANVAPDVNPA